MIRACGLNMELIKSQIVDKYDVSADDKKMISEWYESLIDMMHQEGVSEKGHIQLVRNVIGDVNSFHKELLTSGEDAMYNAKFYSILPTINLLKSKGNDLGMSDIEVCFVFLYGMLTLKHTQKEITDATKQAQQEIVKFLAILSAKYIEAQTLT